MTLYNVFQATMTTEQRRDLNASPLGWDHSDLTKAYSKLAFMNDDNCEEKVWEAAELGLYKHSHIVTADNHDDVFTITNHMPAENAAILWAKPKTRSTSVGDVIWISPFADDNGTSDEPQGWICLPMGWKEMTRKERKKFQSIVPQCMPA